MGGRRESKGRGEIHIPRWWKGGHHLYIREEGPTFLFQRREGGPTFIFQRSEGGPTFIFQRREGGPTFIFQEGEGTI